MPSKTKPYTLAKFNKDALHALKPKPIKPLPPPKVISPEKFAKDLKTIGSPITKPIDTYAKGLGSGLKGIGKGIEMMATAKSFLSNPLLVVCIVGGVVLILVVKK